MKKIEEHFKNKTGEQIFSFFFVHMGYYYNAFLRNR